MRDSGAGSGGLGKAAAQALRHWRLTPLNRVGDSGGEGGGAV
jgi:hypothetical protein